MQNMKISQYIFHLLLVVILILGGCSTSKRTSGTVTTERAPEMETMLNQLLSARIDENWMHAKARVSAELNGSKYDVTAHIHMKKNEIIWINVRKLGFELARLYISNDTILVLNRLDRSYMLYNMTEFSDMIGFPVNLEIMQELLVGNPYLQSSLEWCIGQRANTACLKGSDKHITSEMTFDLPNFTLSESNMLDITKNRLLLSKFQQYQSIKDNKYFSYFRTYQLQSNPDESMYVEIRYTDLEWDSPFEFNMEVPARYSRM